MRHYNIFPFRFVRCRFHCVLSVDLINFCPFHIIHFSRCVKTGNKKRATCLATLLQNKLNSDVGVLPLTFKPVNKQFCCKTGLMWVVKRTTSLFNLFCSNVQDKLHAFCCPFLRTFTTLCNVLSETLPSGLIQST